MDDENGIPIIKGPPKEEDLEKEKERNYKNEQLVIQRWTVGTQIGLVLFGILGFAVSAYQAKSARDSADAALSATRATQEAAYDSCLNAKVSQDTLKEVQKQVNDTHLSATAALYQAMAATESERAVVKVVFEEPFIVGVGSAIGIRYDLRNLGKTDATAISY